MNRSITKEFILRDTAIGFLLASLLISQEWMWEFSSVFQPFFILIFITGTAWVYSLGHWRGNDGKSD